MRAYTFAPIAVREYPTLHLLDNPYIWGGVQFCVNVSEKPYSADMVKALREHGIEWIYCPVSEADGAQWLDSLTSALPKMLAACQAGQKQIVHCDFGNNRSRTFVEVLYYVLKGEQFPDEYKGEFNHLIYNCKQGHLPPVEALEEYLNSLTTGSH